MIFSSCFILQSSQFDALALFVILRCEPVAHIIAHVLRLYAAVNDRICTNSVLWNGDAWCDGSALWVADYHVTLTNDGSVEQIGFTIFRPLVIVSLVALLYGLQSTKVVGQITGVVVV